MLPTTQGPNTSKGDIIKAPRAGRREGVCTSEGAHNGKRVEHANESTDGQKVRHLSKTKQTDEVPHARVKGGFVAKTSPFG